MLNPCWRYFSLWGASGAHFARLAAFVVALGLFLRVLGRSGLDFGGVGDAPWRVLETQNTVFSHLLRANEAALRKCSDPYKTLAGAAKIKVFHICQALRAGSKTTKNRHTSLSNRDSRKDPVKNWSLGSPGSILGGSGLFFAVFWTAFGRS